MKKRILYICVAVVTLLAMSISAFAQELPPEPQASEEPAVSQTQDAAEPTEEATPEPQESTAPAPEPSAEPQPSAAPESSTPPVPEEPAAPVVTEEPAAETPNAPQEAVNVPEPSEAPEKIYDAPAIFLKGIVAKGNDDTLQLTEEQLEDIERALQENLSPYRKEVVMQAYSLVGKVNYFWGGKSTETGWDIRWGNEAIVGSAGSEQMGKTRAYGLDCSGYVLWSFVNAEESLTARGEIETMTKAEVVNRTGYGTAGQWELSKEISWEQAQPGDLAFYGAPSQTPRNHVGIVVGTNEEGQLLVAHCSSTNNNVVVSEAKQAGFQYIRELKFTEAREAGLLAEQEIVVAENGMPMFLTQEQAYQGAVGNGWNMNE
ncbi:MAG: NlpC/P60 family protein [Christensenella sp.]|nr:NlpC/P60 family protein [Christensenella sp.]